MVGPLVSTCVTHIAPLRAELQGAVQHLLACSCCPAACLACSSQLPWAAGDLAPPQLQAGLLQACLQRRDPPCFCCAASCQSPPPSLCLSGLAWWGWPQLHFWSWIGPLQRSRCPQGRVSSSSLRKGMQPSALRHSQGRGAPSCMSAFLQQAEGLRVQSSAALGHRCDRQHRPCPLIRQATSRRLIQRSREISRSAFDRDGDVMDLSAPVLYLSRHFPWELKKRACP